MEGATYAAWFPPDASCSKNCLSTTSPSGCWPWSCLPAVCSTVQWCACRLLPQIDASSWTLLLRRFMVADSLGPPLACTYYMAVPVPGNDDGAGIDLSKQDATPLLACLARNFSAANPDPVFALCPSNTTAMGVGVFAYETEHLSIVEMSPAGPSILGSSPSKGQGQMLAAIDCLGEVPRSPNPSQVCRCRCSFPQVPDVQTA